MTRIAALFLAVLALGVAVAQAAKVPGAPACPVFPASSAWNQRVDKLPVAPNSDRVVAAIGADDHMHADFGSGLWDGGPIGIPVTVVGKTQAKSRVSFEYADESDKGPYPIPRNVAIEGGRASDGDRHALIVDRDSCKLYELFALYPTAAGGWQAGSGAIFDLRSNKLRPAGWTSADAAGLADPPRARPLRGRRARPDRPRAPLHRPGHAPRLRLAGAPLRERQDRSRPAADGDALPPEAELSDRRLPRQARIVLQALKEYGMIVADNGSNWYVSGAPSPKWSNDQLHTLHRVPGSAFEVVDGTKLKP